MNSVYINPDFFISPTIRLAFFCINLFAEEGLKLFVDPAQIIFSVSLIGTFAVMGMIGFSINMITLSGIVYAIGLVVDDAIVVV